MELWSLGRPARRLVTCTDWDSRCPNKGITSYTYFPFVTGSMRNHKLMKFLCVLDITELKYEFCEGPVQNISHPFLISSFVGRCQWLDYTMACRPAVGQQPRDNKKYNDRYWVTASQTSMFTRQQLSYNEKRCFLCSPCWDVIIRTVREMSSVTIGGVWCDVAANLWVSGVKSWLVGELEDRCGSGIVSCCC
jgi:hypothetical protein